uniref:Uncharacterized protein neoY n=1 Tax=Streptomyces fradiae TaxID=1906 RepID=Q2MFH8_STRFR|nr:hypothetical protein, NeoY [Streptomyces fradiae ATCC 10745 = DSM 40063]
MYVRGEPSGGCWVRGMIRAVAGRGAGRRCRAGGAGRFGGVRRGRSAADRVAADRAADRGAGAGGERGGTPDPG